MLSERDKIGVSIAVLALCASGIFFMNRNSGYSGTDKTPQTTAVTEQPYAAGEPESSEAEIQNPVTEAAEPVQTEPEVKYRNETEKRAAEILADMTLEEKVYQLFIADPGALVPEGMDFSPQFANSEEEIRRHPVGGLIYFSESLVYREQCVEMIKKVQSFSKLGMFISVDEEGGEIARIADNPDMGTTSFPDTGTIGDSGDLSAARMEGYTIGSEIRELGFNLDFAPVADVNSNYNNPVIGTRAFSSDPETAAEMVAESVKGFNAGGVMCTLKHFPGHGDTETDSHFGYAETGKTLSELEKCEFVPFRAGIKAGAPFVMAGHISVPEVTGNNEPATLSEEIITGILRNRLGFEGIVITDSMQMEAVTDSYTSAEAAVKAVKAGCDIILMPDNLAEAAEGLKAAVNDGTLTENRIDESVMRILEAKIDYNIIK